MSGAVEVFACWAGDEVDPAIAVEEVDPAYFAERRAPMGEGVLTPGGRPGSWENQP